jgi:hypothetical protein
LDNLDPYLVADTQLAFCPLQIDVYTVRIVRKPAHGKRKLLFEPADNLVASL